MKLTGRKYKSFIKLEISDVKRLLEANFDKKILDLFFAGRVDYIPVTVSSKDPEIGSVATCELRNYGGNPVLTLRKTFKQRIGSEVELEILSLGEVKYRQLFVPGFDVREGKQLLFRIVADEVEIAVDVLERREPRLARMCVDLAFSKSVLTMFYPDAVRTYMVDFVHYKAKIEDELFMKKNPVFVLCLGLKPGERVKKLELGELHEKLKLANFKHIYAPLLDLVYVVE